LRRYLVGPADWIAIASSTEPFFELRFLGGRSGACFVSEFDRTATDQKIDRVVLPSPTTRPRVSLVSGRVGGDPRVLITGIHPGYRHSSTYHGASAG
jgi:hypothetical protein